MNIKTCKSTDDLIQGIREVLSKNRCSFSVKEQVLLEDCIKRLEETKKPNLEVSKKQIETLEVVKILFNIFSITKNLFDLF